MGSRGYLTEKEKEFLSSHRVARMATVDKHGSPLVLPICYVYNGRYIYTPLDKKPKRVSVKELKRVRNILENPNVSVVVDEYSEDWDKLGYIVILGTAGLLESGKEYEDSLRLLCKKYPQYVEMKLPELNLPVIRITPLRFISWGRI
jgi:PPOX class probable F420-dependent enzyme